MELLGVLMLAGCFLAPFAIARAIGRLARRAPATRIGAWLAAALTAGYVALFTHGVFANTSSTAGLAFLMLPLLEALVFGAALAVGWALATLTSRGAQRAYARSILAASIAAVASVAAWSLVRFAVLDRRAGDPAQPPAALRAVPREYAAREGIHTVWAALLARDGNTLPLARLATNPAAPDDVLLALAHHSNGSIAWRAVANANLSETSLRSLATEGGARRLSVVDNPNAPPDLLREIAIDAAADHVLALARHPRLPAELRDPLYTRAVREGDRYARNVAAVQPDLPVELLRVLAQDDWELVRRGVAANWHTPLDLLERLAVNRDENVRSMADHMLERRAAERR